MKQNNQKPNSKKADSIPQIPILAKWQEILRGRRSGVVALIITLSVLIRGIYFYQASQTPVIFQFDKWDQTDMYFFDLWAKKITNGDWLTNESLHPNNIWEKVIAHEYFQKNSDKYAYYIQKANGDTSSVFLSQLLWNHWFQEKTYHQEPLYAYCVALTYKIFGTDVRWVFLWQMLLGTAINVLVFKITTHYFGSLSGLVAGLLSTFCGPLLVYDLVLIRSTMTVFFTLQLLWSLEKWLVDSRRRTAITFGVLMGLAYLNQSYLMLFFIASLILIFFKTVVEKLNFWQQIKFRIQKPAWAILGFSLMLLPLVLRNVAVGVSPFSVAGTGAIVFATANEKTVEPTQIFVVDAPLTSAILSKTDAKMLPTAIETIKSHDSFFGFLGLVAGKFFAVFHWAEIHNNINLYFYQQCAPILKWLGVTNFVIAPLSILGFILSWRRFGTKMLPMTAAVTVAMFPMLFGMVFGRFRVGLLVLLITLSGYFLVEIVKMFSEKNANRWKWFAGLIIVFTITANARLAKFTPVQAWEYEMVYRLFYAKEIRKYAVENNPEKCVALIENFLSIRPKYLDELNIYNKATDIEQNYMGIFFLNIYAMRGKFFKKMGRTADAFDNSKTVINLQLGLNNKDILDEKQPVFEMPDGK